MFVCWGLDGGYDFGTKSLGIGFSSTTFCGIYGSGKLPEMKKKMFIEKNVPFILESINFLPKALNLV